MGHSMGRVHMQKQDLNTMNLMKFKVTHPLPCSPQPTAFSPPQFFFSRAFLQLPFSMLCRTLFSHESALKVQSSLTPPPPPPSGHKAQDFCRPPLGRCCCSSSGWGQQRWGGGEPVQELARHSIRIINTGGLAGADRCGSKRAPKREGRCQPDDERSGSRGFTNGHSVINTKEPPLR